MLYKTERHSSRPPQLGQPEHGCSSIPCFRELKQNNEMSHPYN